MHKNFDTPVYNIHIHVSLSLYLSRGSLTHQVCLMGYMNTSDANKCVGLVRVGRGLWGPCNEMLQRHDCVLIYCNAEMGFPPVQTKKGISESQ